MIKNKIIKYLKEEIDEDVYIPPHYFDSNTTIDKQKENNIVDKTENTSFIPESDNNISKYKLLQELEAEVKKCKKCPLGLSRIKPVFGVGNPNALVMFIGEGPGWEEDHKGEPFVGKAGHLLDMILASIGLSREKVYIANIVKCHPMINPQTPQARGNDRPPTPIEISKCRSYLEDQIKIIKPKCIVTLGNTATRVMLNETKGVSALRGKFYDLPPNLIFNFEIKILPTYHPAALLRNPNLKRDTWEDMKMLRDWLKGQ
ncbi:MAG: uracil-DNA glycosylase [Elusimicrobiota bacterium]